VTVFLAQDDDAARLLALGRQAGSAYVERSDDGERHIGSNEAKLFNLMSAKCSANRPPGAWSRAIMSAHGWQPLTQPPVVLRNTASSAHLSGVADVSGRWAFQLVSKPSASSIRIATMDGRSHPNGGERSLHGHSIGHWEGQTLVIDTTGFADHSDGNFMFVPSGAGKHLVERLTLTDERRHLRYDVELSDPEWLEQPVTHSALLDYHPELEPSGLPCDPEAARRFLEEPSVGSR
jgi:hypothetical protein